MKVQLTLTEKEKVDRLIKYMIDTDDSAENFQEYEDIKEIIKDPIIHSYIDSSINLYNAEKFLKHASDAKDNARKMLYGIAAMIETRFDE